MSNGIGHVWAVNAEGGDEGRPNGVGPVWIENADQLGSKLPEPESGDAGKVLGVLNSNGDIGWVVDQSGTFTQVQADWDETDSSKASFIDNKPDLSVYATGSELSAGLATKQDTISDLATIRSGAAAGATAVQPAALDDYATTSALATGLAAKQDTISDLAAIRSGAAAGATAVQPSSLAAVATTGSYDDLLDKPTIPPGVIVDQTYNAASTNAQSGTAVAGAVATKQDIISDLATIRSGAAAGATAVQPGDLATVATTGAYSDLTGLPTIPVLPTMKNLVAGSNVTITEGSTDVTISATGSSYTAGTGIDITNGVVSADTTVLALKAELPAIGTITL